MVFIFVGLPHKCLAGEQQGAPDAVRGLGVEISSRAVESAAENIDISPLLDNLRRLEEDPLNISDASAAELQQIPGVSAQAAFQIVSYRSSHSIERTEDLRNIHGLEPEVIEALKPYVSFAGKTYRGSAQPTFTMRTRLIRKILQSPPSDDGQYLGSPEKLYNRIAGRFSISSEEHRSKGSSGGLAGSSVSFGILTSKDPGEKKYADLLRGQFVVNVPAYSTRVVVGDFLVDGGQGLVFWRPTGFSKGGEATSGVARNGTGVWPSLSTGQSMTFRGVGINIQPRWVCMHLFYSNKLLDATIDSAGGVTHIASDDLHRTETELAKSARLREYTVGARMAIELGNGFRLGLSGFNSRFDEMVTLDGPFGFRGNQTSAIGLDGFFADGSVSVFAEIAQDQSRARAAVAGFSVNLRSDLTAAFLLRSYSMNYNNFHSSGFSESGDGCKNESGIYAGLTFRPSPWLKITAYVDQFTFPWRTFGSLIASQGHEYYFGADLRIRQNLGIEFQVRQKDKAESNTSFDIAEQNQIGFESKGRNTYRAMFRFEPTQSLCWQNCIEITTVGFEHESVQERGLLFFQDLTAVLGTDLSVSVRVVAFHTDSYNSRVYEYEADLPGAYSSPALFEKGIRWYVLGRYRWGRTLAIALKYSQTGKENSSDRTSGVESQISVQMDLEL
jgi:hypothetical protein